jgi:signal transduction histidine kinase
MAPPNRPRDAGPAAGMPGWRQRLLRALRRGDPAPIDGDRRPALMRWFALTGAAAISLFAVGMALLLSHFIETRFLVRDAAISRDFVQSVFNIQGGARAMHAEGSLNDPRFTEFFAHLGALPDVLRANVYLPDRRVLWSSSAALIGKQFNANEELEEALTGQTVAHIEEDGLPEDHKDEHMLLGARPDEYVEDYLPVYDLAAHQIVCVVELYRRPVALFADIRSGQQWVWGGALAGGLFLFASLMWFVRRADKALRDQQARLVEAEALAMVGELSAAVAHSIRNPLGSIRSSAELQREILRETTPASPSSAAGGNAADIDMNDEIIRNVDRVEHLVRTLLTYAGEPGDRTATTDLAAVLKDVEFRFSPELRAQRKEIGFTVESGLGTVGIDAVLLAQVFNSLLANAAEATRDGDRIDLQARRDGDQVVIDLCDSGAGIEAERLADICKPFYTTKPRGLGLGLALVRRIVLRAGGTLDIASQPGAGTRVRLRLPVRRGPGA